MLWLVNYLSPFHVGVVAALGDSLTVSSSAILHFL